MFGNFSVRHEVGWLRIQVWRGHSDPRLAVSHYTHLQPGYDEAINRFPPNGTGQDSQI
jgi:hypothetical protein